MVKRELFAFIRKEGYNVVRAFDDDPAVTEAWRAQGVPAARVTGYGGCSDPPNNECDVMGA